MIGEVRDAVVRRRGVVALVALVAIVLVAVPAYRSSKDWQAETTVQLDPFPVDGLHAGGAAPTTPEAAMRAEVAAADGNRFREAVTANLDYPVDFDVTGDPASATMDFAVRSDSAERSVRAAWEVASAYVAWGRAQDAVARADALRAQLAAGEASTDAAGELARLEGALARLENGGGSVVVAPEVPGEPVSPRLVVPLVLAGLVGLCAGALLAWRLERRSAGGAPASFPPEGAEATDSAGDAGGTADAEVVERTGSRRDRWIRLALGGLAALLVLPAVASALAAIIGVWELRPSTNPREENLYACLEVWLAPVPDGTVVGVTEDSDVFFRDRFQEVAFPRLGIVDADHPPDLTLRMVPGPGPEACGNYSLERIEP